MTKRNGGFSLVEVLVAIVLLGATIVPISTALVTSIKINDKTESMLQAQLDVSSAVEHLMASGVTGAITESLYGVENDARPDWMPEENSWQKYVLTQDSTNYVDAYEKVYFQITEDASHAFYDVIVTDLNGLVEVETSIRKEAS